jgi:pimeloyl-ACP methyl ester carboxylesterase
MSKTEKQSQFADYITPLHMDGMTGRMLHMPAGTKRNREILLIYGHRASIERMQGIAEVLRGYGAVTMPDLPGFGGMDSFYATGRKPTLDNLADYLATFVKMRYKRRRLTIVGMSFGFVIAARMLQRNPDIAKRVDILISAVGFSHVTDFHFYKQWPYYLMRTGGQLLATAPLAWIGQHVLLQPLFIRAAYRMVEGSNPKLRGASPEEVKRRIDFEIKLWRDNDLRTYAATSVIMFTIDLTGERVALPVHHIQVDADRYFNNAQVAAHLSRIFDTVVVTQSRMDGHAPTIIATAKEAAPFFPAKIRKLLASK